MSRLVHHEPGLAITDGLLAAAGLRAIGHEVAQGDYRDVHAGRWDKAWRLWDGRPMRGEAVYFDPHDVFGWKGRRYPTHGIVDELVDAIRAATRAYPDVAGVEGTDWAALYFAPWLYPVGSALALHQDTGRFSGSFTFFAHARWGLHWGGELVVSPAVPPGARPVDAPRGDAGADEPWLTDEATDTADDPGIGVAVAPRPNRLVLLGPDRPHRITRVDANAGAHVRASIAGFFLRAP